MDKIQTEEIKCAISKLDLVRHQYDMIHYNNEGFIYTGKYVKVDTNTNNLVVLNLN